MNTIDVIDTPEQRAAAAISTALASARALRADIPFRFVATQLRAAILGGDGAQVIGDAYADRFRAWGDRLTDAAARQPADECYQAGAAFCAAMADVLDAYEQAVRPAVAV